MAANNFYRTFTDHLVFSAVATALPETQGAGTMRDLYETINPTSPVTQTLIVNMAKFAEAIMRNLQMTALSDLNNRIVRMSGLGFQAANDLFIQVAI